MAARRILLLCTALILTLGLIACSGGTNSSTGTESEAPSSQETAAEGSKEAEEKGPEPITIRVAWWGNEARAQKYNQILDMYQEKNPHVTILRETANYADYYTKLATQAAGGNAPDLMGMHMLNSGGDYIAKGVLEPLDSYIEQGLINVDDFDKGILESGRVDGKMYGISKGVTFTTIVINKKMLADYGMTLPETTMTYEEYAEFMKELQSKLPDGVYASSDSLRWEHGYDTWARQKGKQLLSADGKALGLTKDDLREYFTYWNDLVKAGVATPGDITAEYANLPQESSTLVKGITATLITNLNQAKIYTNYMEDELDVIRWPLMSNGAFRGGENLQSSAWSISANSKHKEEAAKIIDFFVNDIEAQKIFLAELGIPGNLKVQEAIADQLHPLDVKGFELMAEISKDAPPGTVRPPGAPQVIQALFSYGEQLAFEKMDVDQAVDAAFDEIERILATR